MRHPVRFALAVLLSAAVLVFAAAGVVAQDSSEQAPPEIPTRPRLPADVVDLFARLPVQDGGRVKPLSTFANFTLLAMNGRSETFKTPAGEKLSATEWLLDVLFFPEVAIHYDSFVVDASDVIDAIGVPHEDKSRRDRYSYEALLPGHERLASLEVEYSHIEAKQRSALQEQVVVLGANVRMFERVAMTVSSSANGPGGRESKLAEKLFGADAEATLGGLLARMGDLRKTISAEGGSHGTEFAADPLLQWFFARSQSMDGIAMIPPADDSTEWHVPGSIVDAAWRTDKSMDEEAAALRDLEAVYTAHGDAAKVRAAAESFRNRVVPRAEARGEYAKIPLEVFFYKGDFFYWALCAFLAAFVAVAFSWMLPSKWLTRGAVTAVLAGAALVVTGITLRCIIRSRPPVSTLYETVLFITAIAVLVALAAEYVNRKGIALAMSTLLGAGGMFLAMRYETMDRQDTMPSLVAVLDTNFWLATHVTCVTIGYSAGLLAGAVGHVYVLGKVLGFRKADSGFYKTLTSMTYGMLCFGLVFSVVGTILGGIWANDSWGRFWGWDPKENGALTIVLWELIILHARMAGRIRDFGIAMATIFGAIVVTASWWGVNLLGVGLHSYGFTSGIGFWLSSYWGLELVVLAAGGAWWWLSQQARASAASA